MKSQGYKITVVIGILFLFIGASVLPIISGATQNPGVLKNQSKPGVTGHQKIQNSPQIHVEKSHNSVLNVNQQTQKNVDSKTNTKKTKQVTLKEKHVTHLPSFTPDTTISQTTGNRPKPLGDPVHNINTGLDFPTIQAAIDDEGTLNGHTIVVDSGIYYENVIVSKSLTIRGNNATSIIDGTMGICFNITANSVTLKWLNFTNATTAIRCNASGFTIRNNTFYYDANGVVWIIDKNNLASSQTILASTVKYNTFYSNSLISYQDMVYVDLEFYYLYNSGYTVSIGDITINQNTFYLNDTADTYAIDFDSIYVYYLYGGTISVGKINVSGNTIYGGYKGFDFYGEFNQLKNVGLTVGDIIVTHNLMVNQTSGGEENGYGMYIDYYDGESWSGTTHGVFGKLQITDNAIRSSQDRVYGIEVNDYGYWYNYTGTASLQVGDMIIQDNNVDVTDHAIYFDMEEIGNSVDEPLADHSSVTLGNFIINENTVASSADNAIYIYIDDVGYEMYDYAAFSMGDFTCNDNTINNNQASMPTDNISDTVHIARGYTEGIYNSVTESHYIWDYSPDNTEWSYVYDAPQADPTILSYTDWRDAVNTSPPNMVGKVIYMHIISEDRYFQMNFSFWQGGGGGGFSYTRYEIVEGVVGEGVTFTRPNGGNGGGGIYVSDIDYIGSEMYDHSTCTIGNIQFNHNTISTNNGNGLYFDFIGDIGYDVHNNSQFTMGNLESDSNTILAGNGHGIYIDYSEFGYYMGEKSSDHCVFTMGDITCNNNNITNSGSEGIYTEDLDDLGIEMYGSSTYTMGNIQFNHNNINTSDDSGLYLYDPERFGEDMYNNSQYSMGNLEANDNIIYAGGGNGIYMYYDEFGYNMGKDESNDHCVFVMGDITCNDNTITNSGGEGIYVEYLDYIGYEVYGSSTCTIGNIEFDSNNINTSDYAGMYFDYIGEFGSDMYDNAQFTMGNLEANDNIIYAGGGSGIYFDLSEMGYVMGDDIDYCVFTMGDITVNNNTIHNYGAEAIYANSDGFYGIGYEMYGYSTVTMGDITFNHNTIVTDDNGITIPYMGEFGYEMYDYSVFEMGNIQFNENHIQCGGIGVFIGGNLGEGWGKLGDIGSYMYGSSSFTMGNIEFNTNNITSYDDDGMYIDIWDVGYEMYDDATGTMGDVQINDNVIDSYDTGIYIDYIGDFGEDMYNNSSFTMGDVETSDNIINADDGDGIYIYYEDFGYRMGYYEDLGDPELPTCAFTMGNINCNDNTINNTGAAGIYVAALEYIGSEIDGLCTATMGNITFNHNNIYTNGSHGIAISSDADDEGLEYLGYELLDQAQFTMGNIQINDNMINSTFPGYGLYIWWLGDIGESMNNDAHVTVGSVEINNNILNDGWGDGIDFWIGDFGYDLNNNATVTVRHITMNNNDIISGDDGITDEWSGDFGAEVYDNARYYGGELIVAYNTIDTMNDGIRVLYDTYDLIIGANAILNAGKGIDVKSDSYDLVTAYNTMSGTVNDGILFDGTYNCTIVGNSVNASQNKNGIEFTNSHNNTVLRNTISNNSDTGINLTMSWNNSIYHNNILTNLLQAYDNTSGGNLWDNGYPSGGNYWSDYEGNDVFSGPLQNIPGSDHIGDTPYNITGYTPNDQDRYPLTGRVVINHPSLYTPSNPSPANGATGVSINTDTSWSGGDPDNDYDNYDIYFGTTNPPAYYDTVYFIQGSPIGYKPATLTLDTTYYWKIIAWDAFNDTASGPVWSFITGTPSQYTPPPVISHLAPTADPAGPYNGVVNTVVQFDGTGSHTNGNDGSTIVQYDWKFFDSDTFHNLGPTPTHTYDTVGTYTVTLRVTDSLDGIGITSTNAIIRGINSPPAMPTISGPTTGNVNTAYTYSFTSTDPDNNNIQYVIDWGDGTAKITSAFAASGDSYTASHTWASSGVYSVRAYAQDIYDGISGTATYYVTIGTPTSQPINGYLVDTNGDGIPDSWHNNVTGQTTQAQKQADGTYLIDADGDGVYDQVYNPVTGTYTPYSQVPSGGLPGPWIWGGGALIIIIILILFFLLWRRRKKDEEEEQKK